MRKFISAFLITLICISFVSCDDSSNYEGKVKTPSGSSVMEGRNYDEVVETFAENGF